MDYRFLLQRLGGFIFRPSAAWESIITGNRPLKDDRNSFFAPLLLLTVLCAIAGSLIFANSTLEPAYSIMIGIKFLLLYPSLVYLSALILGEITRALDLGKDFSTSFRLILYTLTPFLLCQSVSHLFESLVFINVLSFYGLYIFWTGSEKLLKPPAHKKMPLLIATAVVIIELYIAGSIMFTSLTDRIYFGFIA
jgi:hypothetical protein